MTTGPSPNPTSSPDPDPASSPNPGPIRGILFDVDRTLFDFDTSEEHGLLAHLADEGLIAHFPTPAAALKLWREILDEAYAAYLAGTLTFAEQQRVRTRRFLARIDLLPADGMSDAAATAWFAGYAAHRDSRWAAFPDAEPLLRALAPAYRLGVVSNSAVAHQRRKLDVIGLLPYLGTALICSEDHGAHKPDPTIFLAGCAALGLPPHQVLFLGDNYAADAIGARDAGLIPCWLDRNATDDGTAARDGIPVIHTLAELPNVLSSTPPAYAPHD
ncbi:HAD family hydrolase [Uniformispora flossi]|uniref:HAD family hydrolase n=1 Tax=Uniformispora flossi TaxID=3390723 RepID=UPI003C2B7A2E